MNPIVINPIITSAAKPIHPRIAKALAAYKAAAGKHVAAKAAVIAIDEARDEAATVAAETAVKKVHAKFAAKASKAKSTLSKLDKAKSAAQTKLIEIGRANGMSTMDIINLTNS